jgi:hypothetical protein
MKHQFVFLVGPKQTFQVLKNWAQEEQGRNQSTSMIGGHVATYQGCITSRLPSNTSQCAKKMTKWGFNEDEKYQHPQPTTTIALVIQHF